MLPISVVIANINHLNEIFNIEKNSFLLNAFNKDQIESEILNPNRLFLVAIHNQMVVGYLIINLLPDICEIVKVAVQKKFRQQGVFKIMLADLINKIKVLGYDTLFLEVSNNNLPAINSYEKLGFNKVSQRKNYYPDNSDAIIYNIKI